MSIIVDAVFLVVMAVLLPDGQTANLAKSFENKAECVAFRSERIEHAKNNRKNDSSVQFYISECTAVPVAQITQ